LLEDEAVGLTEAGERARLGTDVADLDDAALGFRGNDAQHRRCRNGADAGADERAARDGGVAQLIR